MTEKELRQSVVNWLKKYVGIKENSAQHKEILKVFNDSGLCKRYKMTVNDEWCATGTSASFIANKLTDIFPCVECSCGKMIELAKKTGIWEENDAYVPKVGDVIIYDWSDKANFATYDNKEGHDHVGIVSDVSGKSFTVIEANKNETVGYRSMIVNGRYIRGFITPNFAKKATTTTTTQPKVKIDYAEKKDTSISGTYKVKAKNGVVLRSGASVTKTAIVTIKCGEEVKCYGFYTKASNGILWYYVSYKTYTGFVPRTAFESDTTLPPSAFKIEPARDFDANIADAYKVKSNGTALRCGAGSTKQFILTIPQNAEVTCYGYKTGVWYYVKYKNYTGFVESKNLK